MPSDLLDHATSDEDFYAVLGIQTGAAEKEITSAYRRAALKAHPDKNPDDPNAVARFHSLQIAYDVLSDPAAKAAYDNARAAKEARRRQTEQLEGRRRAMKEDLERRETNAFKRKRDEVDAEEQFHQELRRLAEDGRRRRKEREDALLREQEASQAKAATPLSERAPPVSKDSGVPELSRTVKVLWPRDGPGLDLDDSKLESLFSKFGKTETIIIKDKKMRLGGEPKKRLIATAYIVFKSIVGAHAAVTDLKRQTGPEWKVLENIDWAEGKEPDCLHAHLSSPGAGTTSEPEPEKPSHAAEKLRKTFMDSKPTGTKFTNGDGKRKAPYFASFSSAKLNSQTQPGLNFDEISMIRLKKAAERQRLEEQIRKEEEEGNPAN